MKKKMKKILYIVLLVSILQFQSCSKFLDVKLDNNQLTLKETFSKRHSTERYLAHVYSFLPDEFNWLDGEGSVITRSDEALFSYNYGVWNDYRKGNWGVSNTDYHIWSTRYQGINQATIFMNHVLECEELSAELRVQMRAEARFLRAYFYWTLLRQYGPVFIWGDQDADPFIKPETIDRNTLDENVEFILSEYDKAIIDLPKEITESSRLGRITKGVVMAAKAELALYMARPLYNGCSLYKGIQNKDGKFLFPQSPDPQKWETAAKYAKEVIALNQYSLYESDDPTITDPFIKAAKSYQGVFTEKWNNEIIWGQWKSAVSYCGYYQRAMPKNAIKGGGNSGTGVSLKLVDTYPMAESGRYPITGYNGVNPIIDTKSGYVEDGFTDNWTHPIDSWSKFRAHNSIVGRDARFYMSVLANGMSWIENVFQGDKQITFFQGGTATYSTSQECMKSGFLLRKFSDPSVNVGEYKYTGIVWPIYRLAEIYLDYAEACNEKPARDEAEALKYVNLVRRRAGLNNLEVAYPEVIGNQELFRELLRKERMVELAFECHRYYDIRTWMIAEKESNQAPHTLLLSAKNYDDSWKRTDKMFIPGTLVFEKKHYLFPIGQEQLSEMKNITQNYGW